MKRFIKSISLFIAGVPLVGMKPALAGTGEQDRDTQQPEFNPVDLAPLNIDGDNLFAGHRSHSSHSSHRSHSSHSSHYSGSGGYSTPSPPSPSQSAVPPKADEAAEGVKNRVPTESSSASTPQLTLAEKRRLQIMQVQIALTTLGLYSGPVSGDLSADTQTALKRFQTLKELSVTGLMTTETLNALGVKAVSP